MRADAPSIAVEVDDALAADAEPSAKLTEVCPWTSSVSRTTGACGSSRRSSTSARLCGLRLAAAPEGAVKVIKLYDDGALLPCRVTTAQVARLGGT